VSNTLFFAISIYGLYRGVHEWILPVKIERGARECLGIFWVHYRDSKRTTRILGQVMLSVISPFEIDCHELTNRQRKGNNCQSVSQRNWGARRIYILKFLRKRRNWRDWEYLPIHQISLSNTKKLLYVTSLRKQADDSWLQDMLLSDRHLDS
jgi:hypothetical protein